MHLSICVSIATLVGGCNNSGAPQPKASQTTEQTVREVTLEDVAELPSEAQLAAFMWNGTFTDKLKEPAKSGLEQATELELVSLHPYMPEGVSSFDQREVLGVVRISDAKTRQLLLSALDKDVRKWEEEWGSECFDPRHAIRFEHEGKKYSVVICFDCNNIVVYVDGKYQPQLNFFTAGSPVTLQVFNALLTAGKVPLAPE
jgi:hypothetical protein